MRTLIDGYNLMYAQGHMEKRFGPDGFRKARARFLNDLASALGAVEAHQTTVVFDASDPPGHLPRESTFKGITVVFAVDAESADAEIERLIGSQPEPRTLRVVSSDHRIRQAATRRKVRALTADAFWDELEAPRRRESGPSSPSTEEVARLNGLTPEESAEWLEAFRDVIDETDAREALGPGGFAPTDDEIARIEREVEEEFRDRG